MRLSAGEQAQIGKRIPRSQNIQFGGLNLCVHFKVEYLQFLVRM